MRFWHGKKVLITGHTGFKGSWLSQYLLGQGADIVGVSSPKNNQNKLYEILRLEKRIENYYQDIRDKEKLRKIVLKTKPELVFHLAAQPLVMRAYENPHETYETNIMGTINLFEAIRKSDCIKAVINVTSDKCYDNNETIQAYKEECKMGGYDPYSSSKGCSELISNAYRRSFFNAQGIKLATARAGNVIGGGDWAPDRLVPDIIRSISRNQAPVIRNPHAVRPWQHVLDCIGGYVILGEKLASDEKFAEGWNFGPREENLITVGELVNKLISFWGKNIDWEYDKKIHPHEAVYLKLDIAKANQSLGWEPRFSLEETLKLVTEWYKDYYSGIDMISKTNQQIDHYLTKN